jgi:deazaflavin-dependent oxidoreductase (nitroreductase family)
MTLERPEPATWQLFLEEIPMSGPGAWFFSRVLHHVDEPLLRATDGAISVPDVLAGVPAALLTTQGSTSDEEHTVPVLAFRDAEEWIVVASNWGRDEHPEWYHNLRSTPEVVLTRDGVTERCRASVLTGEEREAYWQKLTDRYVGYERHQSRTDRQFPVVRLTPTDDTESDAP